MLTLAPITPTPQGWTTAGPMAATAAGRADPVDERGADAGDDSPPRGCGWFDSSLDLTQGLAVIEHRGFDALPADLPLAWQLATWARSVR